MGVGPEQNFTYIAATRPAIAFIVDIRRGNLDLHLMYKALFELSADRADFVSRLFSRKRPAGLRPTSTAAEIFSAYLQVEPSQDAYERNLKDIQRQLAARHGFALTSDDVKGIRVRLQRVLHVRTRHPVLVDRRVRRGVPADLFGSHAGHRRHGRPRGYLSSQESFAYLKDLETRNLVVPVVGNFSGPKAIRAVGAYLKQRDATVSAFYLSNVEQYLRLQRGWNTFCANVAALPLDDTSTFIRAGHGGRVARGTALTAELGVMAAEVEGCGLR